MQVTLGSLGGVRGVTDSILPAGAGNSGAGFRSALSEAIQSVDSSNRAASQSISRFLSGEGEELHTTALAVERAELTFDLFLQTRNKVVGAYQEIMRMQL
jgi:flagellar hook-basal body complex protein FliE